MKKSVQSVSAYRQFALLAPTGASIPGSFRSIHQNQAHHETLFAALQRLRGRIYLEEGAISANQIDDDGRHWMPRDRDCWHLVTLSESGRVTGCARFLVHGGSPSFSRMNLHRAAIARCTEWGLRVRRAIEDELAVARRSAMSLIEVGGWAITEELRGTAEAVRIALASFAWGQIAGGCIGFTTATVRHGSANILRKLGGDSLFSDGMRVPRYYDPEYGCDMEILRFDSREPNPRFGPILQDVRAALLGAPIVCAEESSRELIALAS